MEATEVPISFSPIHHIANRITFQEYECTICYEVTDNMYRCKGPCHKIYCSKCVGQIKNLKDQCPTKCSPSPFQYEPIPSLPLTFDCPYDPISCPAILTSIPLFQQHARECPFMTPWAVQHFKMQKQFRCGQGHPLSVLTQTLLNANGIELGDFYSTVINDLCWGCKGRGLCRAVCLDCSKQYKKRVVYCVECRKIPLTRGKCPLGHSYIENEHCSYGCICDICGSSGPLKEGKYYSQYTCDIFLCQDCYVVLPEYEEESEKKKEEEEEKEEKGEKEEEKGGKEEEKEEKKGCNKKKEQHLANQLLQLDDLMIDPFDD